jgi:cell division protein YceG involved in septum cleavage
MKLKAMIIVIILTAPLSACSPFSQSNQETQKMVDEFFQIYRNSQKDAVVTLLSKNKWVASDDMDKLVGQLDEMAVAIGKYQGYEKISEATYGKSILQYIYIAKYERQALKFIFRFYKPADQWQFQSFNYELDFTNELDEAGKAYRLPENDKD